VTRGQGQRIAQGLALGHMALIRPAKGARAQKLGAAAQITLQSGFLNLNLVFFIINMPIFIGFLPFLGDIGHFWRPDSWRKLGM
jgi:hypothetical protein